MVGTGVTVAPLTDKEMTLLRGFADGKTYVQLAAELHLSLNTIKSAAQTLYRKLGVRLMGHAVAEGFRQGLLAPQQVAVERDWLLAEASDEVRARFYVARGTTKQSQVSRDEVTDDSE